MERAGRWVTVAGSGAHIRASRNTLNVRRMNTVQEYDLRDVGHLIIVGGHTVHTSAVVSLRRAGIPISFFDADGVPAGQVLPPGYDAGERVKEAQKKIFGYTYALTFARKAADARILAIERMDDRTDRSFLYEGELEFFHRNRDELPYLIKMDELRRVSRLITDTYYEVMARPLPRDAGFRRRTVRPHTDPVNAMLSFGYALLYGTAQCAVFAAGLDPDAGVLHEGDGALVNDLIDGFKPAMVDETVFALVRAGLDATDYETGAGRCILSDALVDRLLLALHESISDEPLAGVVRDLSASLLSGKEFAPVY
ncbi:CRISPR-associated endonuclease Cas1 [uncultured Methanofollis sp.]|uniref:CRISPR-associated endonuclease Cas1 n=1 Tax=uncultured Methanofollis sp. TaxID=262500 RepID=UPI00261D3B63|nr:CRISPR-associated endonuclease Cas1 [uncultured Methanofollis sp.]